MFGMIQTKVIETTEEGRETRYFQCNIPADMWTTEIREQIMQEVEKKVGAKRDSFKFRLGSGYFQPGMKEIFFIYFPK